MKKAESKSQPIPPENSKPVPIDRRRLIEDADYRADLQHIFLTDHFFAARVLGFRDFTERAHRPAVNLYFPKNKNVAMREQHAKHKRIHLDPRHTFKALALDTLVPTPEGFVSMGGIEVGDRVFDPDGKVCNVVGCSPVYESNRCFKLEFSTGETVTADAGHLWVTDSRRDRDRRKLRSVKKTPPQPSVKTTEEIAASVMIRDERNHRIPLAGPIQMPHRALPIAPYVLGCWLGDGTSKAASLTCADPQIIEEILKEGQIIRFANCSDPYKWVFNGGEGHKEYKRRNNNFASNLRSLNLLGNKHIPVGYLRASIAQREALLQGLMDTDGTVNSGTGEAVFSNTNLPLTIQVRELAVSLGYKAKINGPYTAKMNGQSCGFFYHVRFKPYRGDKVFRLKRKADKLQERTGVSLQAHRAISGCEEVESVPVRCIMVDSPSQQFLITDGFIPTHNTTLKRVDRIQWICAFPEEVTILIESSTQKLASKSSEATSRAFYSPKGVPTVFQLLWPHMVVEKEPKAIWNTPNRRASGAGDLDATLDFTSPQTSQAGFHPFIIEPDDVEDANNSGISATTDVRQNVIDICDQNENLLRDGGYMNICGTRYHPFDWYAKQLRRAEMNPHNWEALVRCSVKVKTGAKLVPGVFPEEQDVELQFPEFMNLSYDELRDKYLNNYESFMCQQQNDPQGGHIARFEERDYNAAQIDSTRIPNYGGEVYICWRPRYGGKQNMAKYSEGACARIVDGRIYILDAWQGQYTPTGEAEKIVQQIREHSADGLLLMAVPGSEYVGSHVRNEALKKNRSVKMQWIDFDDDDYRRTAQMEQLEPMIKAGRILFSTAMGKAHECRKQFVHFGLVEENGIVHAISQFAELVPISLMRTNMQQEELDYHRRRREDALVSHYMDQQGMMAASEEARMKAVAHLEAMSQTVNFNMPALPGGLDG